MNIFTAATAGLAIVIKKIGIGFKSVMTGLKIAIISVIDFIVSVITAVINAIVSAIKWVLTQIVNLIHWLFRTYLRFECGCVPPVQKFAGLMIRLRWGFVIVSVLYAVYQYLGIKALVVAIITCGGLVAIGYSEDEKEEEEWNAIISKINNLIVKYLKYFIRFLFFLFSLYMSFHYIAEKYKNSRRVVVKDEDKLADIIREKLSLDFMMDTTNYFSFQIKDYLNVYPPLSFYGYGDFNSDGHRDLAIAVRSMKNLSDSKIVILWAPSFNSYFTIINNSYPFRIIQNPQSDIKNEVIELHDFGKKSWVMYWDGNDFQKSSAR